MIKLQIRVNPLVKKKVKAILKINGLNISTAIRIYLHKIIAHNGLPFEVKKKEQKMTMGELFAYLNPKP